MTNIEIEIRSFISERDYARLLAFFNMNAKFIKKTSQETFYFDTDTDLRIQKSEDSAKIWLKKGLIHDEAREEIEIQINKEDFENAETLFKTLGYKTQIKWFRNRIQYDWNNIKVTLDKTKGYGYIIELEKISNDSKEKDTILNILKQKMNELNISITPKQEFNEKFEDYKKNWKQLTRSE